MKKSMDIKYRHIMESSLFLNEMMNNPDSWYVIDFKKIRYLDYYTKFSDVIKLYPLSKINSQFKEIHGIHSMYLKNIFHENKNNSILAWINTIRHHSGKRPINGVYLLQHTSILQIIMSYISNDDIINYYTYLHYKNTISKYTIFKMKEHEEEYGHFVEFY